MKSNDPYLRQLRRELTLAQARLKRVERERDELKQRLAERDKVITVAKRMLIQVLKDTE